MKYNPSNEHLGKTLINIIKVMQRIALTESTDRTTITPEKLGGAIEQMAHDIPSIWSWVYNGSFRSIVRHKKNIFRTH